MKKFSLGIILILGIGMSAPVAYAEILWSEDFADVSDWRVISDSGGGADITVSEGLGAMYVDKRNSIAAFAPEQNDANLVPFDPMQKSEYTINWKVDHLTKSVSWDISIDEFNVDKEYLDTVWNVYPTKSSTARSGEFSENLREKSWDAKTAYIVPKVTVHTGGKQQTVYFGYMNIERKGKLTRLF